MKYQYSHFVPQLLHNASVFPCFGKKHPGHIIHPHPHVLRQCVHLEPDQGEACLLQALTDLRLVQRDHGDLDPRPAEVITLSQGADEQEVAAGTQELPDVAQCSGEGRQVGADALQAEGGH